jgi:hypothetical protein
MTAPSITNATFINISQYEFVDVRLHSTTNQQSLHATVSFTAGDIITKFGAAAIHKQASYLTIQIGKGKHIELLPTFLQYTNHCCEPNVFFDTTTMELICLLPIYPNDELRFFYPSTEWEMAQPFVCNCGCSNCLQLINGAANLSAATLSNYKLSDFILHQLKEKS